MNKIYLLLLVFLLPMQYVYAAPDYQTDFSTSTGWTPNDSSKINIDTVTNQWLDVNIVRDGTNDAGVIDLQDAGTMNEMLDDTAWVMRYKMVVLSIDPGHALSKGWHTGGTDKNHTVDYDDTGADGLYLVLRTSSGTTDFFIREVNGGTSTDTTFSTVPTTTTYYVQLIRLSSTSFKGEFYSDSSFTTLIESKTMTISSTVQSLRYFKVTNNNSSSVTGSITGYIDDLKICNGFTVYTDCEGAHPDDVTYLRTVPGANYMFLEWEFNSTLAQADGFYIERMTTMGGSWSVLTSDTGDSNTYYYDSGLALDTWYNYRIKALNGTHNSTNWSNESNNYTLEDPNACLIPGAIWVY